MTRFKLLYAIHSKANYENNVERRRRAAVLIRKCWTKRIQQSKQEEIQSMTADFGCSGQT